MALASAISIAVEGLCDAAVASRLVKHVGREPGRLYGTEGKQKLLQRLSGYNEAAQYSSWLVIVDLEQITTCVPTFCLKYLSNPANGLVFRVAVREMESWLLADRERLSEFLGIASSRIPLNPDSLTDPKKFLVNLARHSKRRSIREDMVPAPSGGRVVGPGYTSRLIEFVSDTQTGWRPEVVAVQDGSESLRRCLNQLRKLP